jgi:prolyl oligopeptidase
MQLTTTFPDPVTETIHGIPITDPFRWLEDRTSDSTSTWIADQKLRHDEYFAGISGLESLRDRVDTYLNVGVSDQAVRVADKLFLRRREKAQEQACILIQDTETQETRVLVDPSSQGRFVSTAIHRLSNDGSLLAYELKHGGSDATEIHFAFTAATGPTLPDHLSLGYPRGVVFALNGVGFFYCHEDLSRTEDHTICFHEFGSGSDDRILFRSKRTPHSRLVLIADVVHLGIVYRHEVGTELRTDFLLADHGPNPTWATVFADRPFPYEPLLHRGRIFVYTQENAPNARVLELSKDGNEIGIFIPESPSPIAQFTWAGDALYVRYLIERKCVVRSFSLVDERVETLPLSNEGTIYLLPSLTSNPEFLFYAHESFTEPRRIYEHEPRLRNPTLWAKTDCSVNTYTFQIHEQWYTSYDGTKIPIFLVTRRDVEQTAPQPVVMTSYGGFGVSMTPRFSVLTTILLELGVVFALPGIRGGSEFGKGWHEAARGRNRQVAISDFIAAAEWLSVWRTPRPRKLGIFGGSNSGLLVAAAMSQRPDLFLAVLCIAPLLDMVRYELFDNARRWQREYGTVCSPEDFAALYGYSPYHHVTDEVNYPATLFVVGDQDDRCNPAHVRKMAARLQNRSAQIRPILVDYSAERGHSPVLPLSVRTEALARRIAFFCKELQIPLDHGDIQ